MIEIAKDIPIPPPSRSKNINPRGVLKATLAALEIGWSFHYPIRDGVHRHARDIGMRVKVKAEGDGLVAQHAIFGGTQIVNAAFTDGVKTGIFLIRPKSFAPEESGGGVCPKRWQEHSRSG